MSGVGTELSRLIPDWAVKQGSGCNCKSVAKKWDKYGVAWCERNRELIVGHLLGQSDHLIPAFKLVPEAARKLVADKLLNKAIRAAKE